MALTQAQLKAVEEVRNHAQLKLEDANHRIEAVLGQSLDPNLALALANLGRATIHFHPDRLSFDGRAVIHSLLEDGVYKSQFETKISNGGLTAFPGGDRDCWEERMFSAAYHFPERAPDSERPKYGALDIFRHIDGPAPRFGSCYFRLKASVLTRSTFTWGDSYSNPTDFGTIDRLEPVLAGLLEAVSSGKATLGVPDLDPNRLVTHLTSTSSPALSTSHRGRSLDEYIEVQIHGPISLHHDIEGLFCDGSFKGTRIGELLEQLANCNSFPLFWIGSVQISLNRFEMVPTSFRGPQMHLLARRLGLTFQSDAIKAELIGRAAVTVVKEPQIWSDWGSPHETLQHLKQLWHCLVAYGE